MRKVQVNMTEASLCRKCGLVPAFRHHKGNDGYLGRYNRSILRNYKKFLDCVLLCVDCHCIIHFMYDQKMKHWVNRTPKGALHFRQVCIDLCDQWLAGKIPTPKVPKLYKANFLRSLDQWKKDQSVTGSTGT